MKKILLLILSASLIYAPAAFAKDGNYKASGEVVSVDPVYSRITIAHDPIKGFSGDSQTEFTVKSNDLLKDISTLDTVDFEVEASNGEANITKLTKTGHAAPRPDGIPVGQAAQDVFEGAGNIVKTVASPIAPLSEVTNATADATTNTTGSVLNETKPSAGDGGIGSKQKF